MSSLKKNVASQNVTFGLINASSGAALTGATVTVYVTKDNTYAVGTGTVTESKIAGTGYGDYNYAPTQAETNATNVGLKFVATGAIPVTYTFLTDVVDANGYLGVNMVDIGGQTVTAATGVTFPTSVASPTNITAGTIATVTNLTNAPTSGDLTATMKTSVLAQANAATTVGLAATQSFNNAGQTTKIPATMGSTDYTGNTVQTGDSFTRLGAPSGASIEADIAAVLAATQAINNSSAQIKVVVPNQLILPSSGTTVYEFDVWLYTTEGANVNADGASNGIGSITFGVKNQAGTSLSSQLGIVTYISTGGYKISYTVNSSDTAQQLVITASATVNSVIRTMTAQTLVDYDFATTFTAGNATTLNGIATTLGTAGAGLTAVPVNAINVVGNLPANMTQINGSSAVATTGKLWTLDTAGNAQSTASALAALVTTVGTPMQVGNVTVGGYATNEDPLYLLTGGTTQIAVGAGGLLALTAAAQLAVVDAVLAGFVFDGGGNVKSTPQTAVNLNLSQPLNAARALDSITDTELTLNDAFQAAIGATAGQESIVGTAYKTKTPTGTVLRTFTLDSATTPTSRS